MDTFTKQPFEEFLISVDFEPRLPSGASVATVAVSARLDVDGSDQSSTILSDTNAQVTGAVAQIMVKAGLLQQDYVVTFRATLTPSGKLEKDVLMRVRET